MIMNKYFLSILLFFLISFPAHAQEDSLKMTLTPPLVKNNMNPGESWMSNVKLVNNNKEELVIYTEIVDFKSGPNGGVEFIFDEEDLGEDKNSGYLKAWMQIQEGPFTIPPFGNVEIPFQIKVPEEAGPGGHYAAILAGTKPASSFDGSGIGISSMISSLILINISGDVVESGRIREFSTDKTYYDEPEVKIKLRFENTGNVHLQPKGNITIKNMFGDELGYIDINKNTAYGNILPGSTKTWEFPWKGEKGITKMGKYSAEVKVFFGEKIAEVDTRTFYFWYVNFKIVGIILGSILGFFIFVIIIIKLYIRRAINLSQKEIEKIRNNNFQAEKVNEKSSQINNSNKEEKIINQRKNESKIVDLKELMKNKK